MQPSIYYLQLLDEINRRFEQPDWPSVREWLEEQADRERIREDPFVPTSLETLAEAGDFVLHAGDVIRSPLLIRNTEYAIPPHCQLTASLHALGSVEIGQGVQITEDVLASDTIRWRGGAKSVVRNLVAPHVHLDSPSGTIQGGIWCNTLSSNEQKIDLAADSVVQGVVVVDQPTNGKLIVGRGSRVGGLYVQGDIETKAEVSCSSIQAQGNIQIGRQNQIGFIEGNQISANRHSKLGVIVSHGTVKLAKSCVVDTIRAQEDIVLDETVIVTGHVLLSEEGRLHIPPGTRWHSRREHWFYMLAGDTQSLQPYTDELARPAQSQLLVIRALTHSLWEQIVRLSGRF
jgi:hypothetical protein